MVARIISSLSLALLVSGCAIVDGYYEAQELRLRLVTKDPSQYSVRLSDSASQSINVPASGEVVLPVPLVRWGEQRVFGIPLKRRSSYLPRVQVTSRASTVTEFKIPAIKQTQADVFGYHPIKIKTNDG